MQLHLEKHIAVVTGGASGIGRAIAEGFAAEGADVAIWDISKESRAVAKEIAEKYGVRVRWFFVDIADADMVQAACEVVEDEFGPVDHLVHCAAIGSGKFGFPYTNLTPADWIKPVQINILGMTHVAHSFGPLLRDRRKGTMIFIASVAGQIGSQTDPPYSATKAANINFAQCLAKDLAESGVRVNTVCPGMVATPLNQDVWRAWHDQAPPEQHKTYAEWAQEKINKVVPLGRWQTPADIADMVVFLSSDRAAQVTGQTINVDGGFVMHW